MLDEHADADTRFVVFQPRGDGGDACLSLNRLVRNLGKRRRINATVLVPGLTRSDATPSQFQRHVGEFMARNRVKRFYPQDDGISMKDLALLLPQNITISRSW